MLGLFKIIFTLWGINVALTQSTAFYFDNLSHADSPPKLTGNKTATELSTDT